MRKHKMNDTGKMSLKERTIAAFAFLVACAVIIIFTANY